MVSNVRAVAMHAQCSAVSYASESLGRALTEVSRKIIWTRVICGPAENVGLGCITVLIRHTF